MVIEASTMVTRCYKPIKYLFFIK